MGLLDLFKLAKLVIEAYEDSARSTPVGEPFEVQYNPESLSLRHESVFQGRQGALTSSAQARFSHSPPKSLSVNLVIDGTGVDHFGIELLASPPTVAERIQTFLDLCYRIQGDIHEPAYLKLLWGKGVLEPSFDCRLKSVDINYTSFERDGSPLHAELACAFVEDLHPPKRAARDRTSSPDLSHERVVVAGDTLPLLCREIYGSTKHYLRVAEVNGLDGFRQLEPGTRLVFPPFAPRDEG